MNKGFKTYFKYGLEKCKKIYKQKENFLRFYLFQLMNAVSYLVPFLHPACSMADVRMARLARESDKIEITQSFASANKPQKFWTSLITAFVYLMLLAGGLLILYIAWFAINTLLTSFVANNIRAFDIVSIVVLIPFVLLAILYVVMLSITFAPRYYAIDTVDEISATTALDISRCTMNQKVKTTYFLIQFVPTIIVVILFAITIISLFCLFNIGQFIAGGIVSFIFFILTIFFDAILIMARKEATLQFFDDVIVDKINVLKTVDKVHVKKFTSGTVDKKILKGNLIKLFDDQEDIKYTPKDELFNDDTVDLEEKETEDIKPVEFSETVDDVKSNDESIKETPIVKEEVKEETNSLEEETINLDEIKETAETEEIKVESNEVKEETTEVKEKKGNPFKKLFKKGGK